MNTELKVTHRNEYGIDRYYPAYSRSQIFADIAGKNLEQSNNDIYKGIGLHFSSRKGGTMTLFMTIYLSIIGLLVIGATVGSFILSWLIVRDICK